jgi:hypothetical protein
VSSFLHYQLKSDDRVAPVTRNPKKVIRSLRSRIFSYIFVNSAMEWDQNFNGAQNFFRSLRSRTFPGYFLSQQWSRTVLWQLGWLAPTTPQKSRPSQGQWSILYSYGIFVNHHNGTTFGLFNTYTIQIFLSVRKMPIISAQCRILSYNVQCVHSLSSGAPLTALCLEIYNLQCGSTVASVRIGLLVNHHPALNCIWKYSCIHFKCSLIRSTTASLPPVHQ